MVEQVLGRNKGSWSRQSFSGVVSRQVIFFMSRRGLVTTKGFYVVTECNCVAIEFLELCRGRIILCRDRVRPQPRGPTATRSRPRVFLAR